MPAALKGQWYVGTNDGTVDADWRKSRGEFEGHAEGDEHRTVFEVQLTDEEAEELLPLLPKMNRLFARSTNRPDVEAMLGKKMGFRVAIYDE